jgi:hypothetical protein
VSRSSRKVFMVDRRRVSICAERDAVRVDDLDASTALSSFWENKNDAWVIVMENSKRNCTV